MLPVLLGQGILGDAEMDLSPAVIAMMAITSRVLIVSMAMWLDKGKGIVPQVMAPGVAGVLSVLATEDKGHMACLVFPLHSSTLSMGNHMQ